MTNNSLILGPRLKMPGPLEATVDGYHHYLTLIYLFNCLMLQGQKKYLLCALALLAKCIYKRGKMIKYV